MVNWGRPGWKFLHSVTFAYPEKPNTLTKMRYMAFFKSLRHVLPCPMCRLSYAHSVKSLTMKHMKNTETLSRWLVGVHNKVNFKLGKRLYGYDEVKQMYTG